VSNPVSWCTLRPVRSFGTYDCLAFYRESDKPVRALLQGSLGQRGLHHVEVTGARWEKLAML
jgi:hypothetical protein